MPPIRRFPPVCTLLLILATGLKPAPLMAAPPDTAETAVRQQQTQWLQQQQLHRQFYADKDIYLDNAHQETKEETTAVREETPALPSNRR